ncbi:MAG: HYR domain-containing protein, partial [Armatimonadota bacterium]
MRTALYAFLVVAFGAIGHLPSHAGEISIAGYTNGCFNCASVPDASTPQDASSLGLLFENALFQGTTSAGILALGGVAPGSVPPFSDVLGTVRLSTAYADYTTKSFNLRVTFSAPVGIVSGNGSVWQATLAGAVYSTDSGGVFIDFDNTPQSFSYTGASGVGSFQFSVNDVAIEPGQTATITGQVMQADGVPPWNPICPSNIEVNQDIGVCSASVSLPAGNTQTSGDMLASQPVLSYFVAGQTISWPHTFPVGITVVHVEDGLGWSCNFTVRVKDNEPSVLTDCPADQTVPMELGKNSAVVNFNMPSVADCSPTTLSATLPSGTTLGMGTFPISIIAIDSGGYRSTCSFTIKVVDTQSPVPDVPELPTVNSACYAKVAPPTATDNFAGKISASTTDATEFNAQGVYTITWVYNDGNGNTAQQQQTVIVQDTENPKVQCPAPLSIPMEGSSAAIPDLKIGLQISDNCTPKELLVVTQVPAPGSSVGPGNYTVVLTVIDAAGNQTTCEAVVNIL